MKTLLFIKADNLIEHLHKKITNKLLNEENRKIEEHEITIKNMNNNKHLSDEIKMKAKHMEAVINQKNIHIKSNNNSITRDIHTLNKDLENEKNESVCKNVDIEDVHINTDTKKDINLDSSDNPHVNTLNKSAEKDRYIE